MAFNFMSIGDKNYFDIIEISVRQLFQLYPESAFYVYDWGFTSEQAAQLRANRNVVLVDWKDKLVEFDAVNKVDWTSTLKKRIKEEVEPKSKLKWFVMKNILYRVGNRLKKRAATHAAFENLVCNYPLCILDCLGRHQGPMVYIDGDAFLVENIDEISTDDYDVGVTVRRMHELDFSFDNCQVVNGGVLFFNGTHEKNTAFVKEWIRRRDSTHEYIIVQSALTRMIAEANPTIFEDYYSTGELSTPDGTVVVKTFPCEIYNYNWIEEGVDASTNKIWHFKGSRHSIGQLKQLLAEVGMDKLGAVNPATHPKETLRNI